MATQGRSIFCGLMLVAIVGAGIRAHGEGLSRYVTDQTESLNASEQAALEAKLSNFDAVTSTQIVVVIVPTIGSESLESTSLRIAEENGVGQKGRNNGVVLFVAKNDRRIRIEVGYGLEGVLTDIISGQIIRYEITPRFREGKFFEGIDAGVDAIMKATKNEYVADRTRGSSKGTNLLPIILVFFFLTYFLRRRRRGLVGGGLPFMFFPGGGFSGGSGGGGGGGFSGGGGSFGGGGASGSW